MKLFSKLLMLLVIAAIAGPFFIKDSNGAPLWRWQNTVAALNQWRTDLFTDTASIVLPDIATVSVYRWKDSSGQWHFSNDAPVGQEFDELLIDPKTNAVRAKLEQPQEDTDASQTNTDADTPSPYVSPLIPLPDPETTKQLLQDARALQALADERQSALESL